MKVEIDQSVKIEQINRDTIIAFSNNISFAVVIPAKAKKHIKQRFRQEGRPYLFYYRTFAAGVTLLVERHLRSIDTLVIDREYPGKEQLIKRMILEMINRLSKKYVLPPQIYFRLIRLLT